jgi:hypothetical protein
MSWGRLWQNEAPGTASAGGITGFFSAIGEDEPPHILDCGCQTGLYSRNNAGPWRIVGTYNRSQWCYSMTAIYGTEDPPNIIGYDWPALMAGYNPDETNVLELKLLGDGHPLIIDVDWVETGPIESASQYIIGATNRTLTIDPSTIVSDPENTLSASFKLSPLR